MALGATMIIRSEASAMKKIVSDVARCTKTVYIWGENLQP
jgi:hypothetical protein